MTRNGHRAHAAGRLAAPVGDTSIPDALLPDQYFDRLAARAADTPIKRLMFAVLLDAVIHMQRRGSMGATEVETWIREDGVEWPFSFHNVCDALGIDATYLARGLLAWRANSVGPAGSVGVRQVRTSHNRVTPLGRRRRAQMPAPSR